MASPAVSAVAQTPVKKDYKQFDPTSVSPRTLWGKIIIYLREHHFVALHVACGDVTDVEFTDGVFYIKTEETFIYDLLKNPDNKNDLFQAFNAFGVQKFELVKKQKATDKAFEDIEKLKEFVGDYLQIKQGGK